MPVINKAKGIVLNTTTQLGYKVFTALLNQASTDAPTQTILQNTLNCTITWVYVSQGLYKAVSNGIFTAGRTSIYLGSNRLPNTTTIITTSGLTTNEFYLECSDGDDSILDLPITITVYN